MQQLISGLYLRTLFACKNFLQEAVGCVRILFRYYFHRAYATMSFRLLNKNLCFFESCLDFNPFLRETTRITWIVRRHQSKLSPICNFMLFYGAPYEQGCFTSLCVHLALMYKVVHLLCYCLKHNSVERMYGQPKQSVCRVFICSRLHQIFAINPKRTMYTYCQDG